MNAANLSLLALTAFFTIYGVFCAVSGSSVLVWLLQSPPDSKTPNPQPVKVYREVASIFLGLGAVALALLFNRVFKSTGHPVLYILAIALIAFLLRAFVAVWIFYVKRGIVDKVNAVLFLLANFTVPLSFSAAGIYLLTGQFFWQTHLGWALSAVAVFGAWAQGLLLVNRRANKKDRMAGELFFALWLLALGSLVPLLVEHSSNSLQSAPLVVLQILCGTGLVALMAQYMGIIKRKLWLVAGAISLAAPLLLAWANRPYLIAGKLTIARAFTSQFYAAGLVVCLLLIGVCLWLFFKPLKIRPGS